MHIWSERRDAVLRELVADIATITWVVAWVGIGIRLYGFLANLAGAGRFIRDGGIGIDDAGTHVSGALRGLPLVGERMAAGVEGAFDAAAQPIVRFGTDLERLLIIIAALLGLILVAVALVPWLNRYVPWRIARWRRLNAGARAIRRRRVRGGPAVAAADVERLLASRALHRLEYDELLEFTPDPFGDWLSGRHDRLAQAELDRVGLRTVGALR
jgi:hypothetical protein